MELVLFRNGETVHTQAIPAQGLSIGRSTENQLALSEPSISRRHAQLFCFEGRLWIRDLGSANGTFVNHVRLVGAVPISDRDELKLGRRLIARVHGAPAAPDDEDIGENAVLVEDVWSLLRHSLTPGHWRLDADGTLSEDTTGANIQVAPGGVCLVLQSGEWTPLNIDKETVLAGRGLRRVAVGTGQLATLGTGTDRGLDYTLVCDLDAPGGAVAWMQQHRGERQRVCGGNGAVLLFQLGGALARDRREQLAEAQAGWCEDDRLGRGVWGRAWTTHDPNGLHVLLYRVRKAIARAGFDPACIQKERGMTRIHVQTPEGRP